MIEVTQHVKNEWARFAQAAYANGRNDLGHRFSSAAALRSGSTIAVSRFDELQSQYRAWLCFNEYPPAPEETAGYLLDIQIESAERQHLASLPAFDDDPSGDFKDTAWRD